VAAFVDVKNPVEIRVAGLRSLNEATRVFMMQSVGGTGDYTREKYEQPEPSFEELTAELRQIDAAMRTSGRYDS
jgi:hypothetical protein